MTNTSLPQSIVSEAELDDALSLPTPDVVDLMRRLAGDIILLGVAGKIGVGLAQMAVRAIHAAGVNKRVIGVSRFSDPAVPEHLAAMGVEPIACDLLDPDSVAGLPRVPNVIFLAGRKFGTEGHQELTWAINTLVPAYVARHFAGSRIVAFSTGCVYPLVSVETGGCTEATSPDPVGEYAQSCLGRERLFEYFSTAQQTPVCLFRLNYANALHYGVLHDIAQRILHDQPIDLTVGHVNVIWQGDVNRYTLRALEACRIPAAPLNVTRPEILSVRDLATALAAHMGKTVTFTGKDGDAAYLNNPAAAMEQFGPPRVSVQQLIAWTADWVQSGGQSLGKPTHFEVSTGRY